MNDISVQRLALHDHETEVGIAGNGPETALFFHCIGLSWRMWQEVLRAFPEGMRVIACDLRGHGAADTVLPTTLEQHVADACEILDLLQVERAHICGLSYGGAVAQMTAILRPDRVLSLGLCATFARAPKEILLERAEDAERRGIAAHVENTLARWFVPSELQNNTSGVQYVRERLLADRVENWAAAWRTLSAMDATEQLPNVTVPATVVAGELDPTTPPATLRAIADALPHARYHEIPGCSHVFTLERPEAAANILAEGFARAHQGAS